LSVQNAIANGQLSNTLSSVSQSAQRAANFDDDRANLIRSAKTTNTSAGFCMAKVCRTSCTFGRTARTALTIGAACTHQHLDRLRRLEAVVHSRDKPQFSASVTAYLADG
jgi:hypothetical protein